MPELEVIDQVVWEGETQFPYVPGLLSFREIPALLEALELLQIWPDLIMVDGQGRAHPRRLGIASHLGVLLDMPTIGVAKSRLTGYHHEVGAERGAQAPLRSGGEVIGAVLRTKTDVRPLYVSVGHRITLPEAVQWVLTCTTKYRLPETTRLADKLSKRPKSGRSEEMI
jgi:deoxyribonuclease V